MSIVAMVVGNSIRLDVVTVVMKVNFWNNPK